MCHTVLLALLLILVTLAPYVVFRSFQLFLTLVCGGYAIKEPFKVRWIVFQVKLGEPGYKERYYAEKFGVQEPKLIDNVKRDVVSHFQIFCSLNRTLQSINSSNKGVCHANNSIQPAICLEIVLGDNR